MLLKVGVILAVASGVVAVAGCAEEPAAIGPGVYPALAAADIATVGAPSSSDLPFGEALVTFSHELGDLHAADGERADPQIQWQVRQLATILDRLPAAGAQPALRRAAALMRAAEEGQSPSMETTKRALAIAAGALLQLVPRAYYGMPEIDERAREFAGAVSAIDAAREPPDRAAAIVALLRAERLLAAMYAANVAPPR